MFPTAMLGVCCAAMAMEERIGADSVMEEGVGSRCSIVDGGYRMEEVQSWELRREMIQPSAMTVLLWQRRLEGREVWSWQQGIVMDGCLGKVGWKGGIYYCFNCC